MFRNFFNQNDNMRETDALKDQQFGPGRSPIPPVMPPNAGQGQQGQRGQRQTPPMPPTFTPESPRGIGQPPSPPPNFIPQMPQMEGQPQIGRGAEPQIGRGAEPQIGRGTEGFSSPFGERDRNRRPPRQMNGCLNRFTYIWLINGNNFWFYPTFIGFRAVEGFRWRRNGWVYERINLNRIFFFTCF